MAVSVTHATVAAGTDSGTGEIHKAQWNAAHTMSMATARLLGRTTAAAGAVEEISVATPMTLTAGVLGGLGTIASQSANAVAITGGNIDGCVLDLAQINNSLIGNTTPASATVTQLTATTGNISATLGLVAAGTYLTSTSGLAAFLGSTIPAWYRTLGTGSWPFTEVGHAVVEARALASRGVCEVTGATGAVRRYMNSDGIIHEAAAGLTAVAGSAGSTARATFRKTGIANNSATNIITVTVPNAMHNAAIFLDILAHLGTGTDASESSRCAQGCIVLARATGGATVAVAATLALAQIATTAGGGTLTLAYGVTAMTGAVSATQTFSITVTLVVTGTITDHTCVVQAQLVNSAATGVTMAAA